MHATIYTIVEIEIDRFNLIRMSTGQASEFNSADKNLCVQIRLNPDLQQSLRGYFGEPKP